MEKYIKKIKKEHYGVVAFVLAVITMYVMLSYEEALSTGRFIVTKGDLLHQYVPFIKLFVRNILGGESLWQSWEVSLGANTSLCYAYYALSPFNVLYLIFYNVDEAIITGAVIILKTGFIAFCFQRFVSKTLKCDGVESIIFSLFYAMCSFHVLYNTINIAWMDALYMLPVICTLIVSLIKEGKWKGLVIAYAYLFVVQFYMAYIVGVFSFFFLIIFLFCNEFSTIKESVNRLFKYIGVVILAIGSAAIVWIPVGVFLMNNVGGMATDAELDATILDIFLNLFWGRFQGIEGTYPYIYCGIPALLLLPYYFVNRKIKTREKIGNAILLLTLIACMLNPFLYTVMHAFDKPGCFGFRFSFIVSFILCYMACRQCANCSELKKRIVIAFAGVEIILFAATIIVQNIGKNEFEGQVWFNFVINMLIILVWLAILCIYSKQKMKGMTYATVCVFLAICEVITNGYMSRKEVIYPQERPHLIYKDSMESGLDQIVDGDFYRICYYNECTFNSDARFGYKGVQEFNSGIHINSQKAMEKLGFYTSTNAVYEYGMTPVTEMLFGVKYRIKGVYPYAAWLNIPSATVETNNRALALGYMTNQSILDFEFSGNNVFTNMDSLLGTMLGENVKCFEAIPLEYVVVTTDNAILESVGNVMKVERGSEEDGYITYQVKKEEREAYVQFEREKSVYTPYVPRLLGGEENRINSNGALTVSYAKKMIDKDGNYEVVIWIGSKHISPVAYDNANFVYYNDEELTKAYDILSANQMNVIEYENGYVHADITVSDDKTVLFTTIPYDAGWTVYVDGVETQTQAVVGDAFLALELAPGYHDLVFEYEAPGAQMGMTVSGVSIGLYAGCILIEYIINRKRKAKEGTIEPDVEDRTE